MRNAVRAIAVVILTSITTPLGAQTDAAAPRMIKVDGVDVRVRTSGLERRAPGQPVLLLEAGSGATLETWNPVFDELARLGPVVAYDRFGLGESGADPKIPTLARNVQTLRDVARALAPPELPEIPADTPAKLRPVYEQLLREMRDDFPSARQWKQPANLPVGVIVTARADRLRGDGGAMVRLQIKHQIEWTLQSADSVFTIAGHTGHQVHRDDPELVVSMVRHVYSRAQKQK